MADPSHDERIETLLACCLEHEGAEREAAVAEAARRHPELAAKLEARLAWLGAIGLAQRPRPLELPERLGEFRVLARLGGGGMGVVHLAEQTSLGRRVALKTIRPEQLWFPGARERFEREVRTVAQLKHPSIVAVHAVGEEAGVPWFAMEWIEGLTLAELLVELAGREPRRLAGRDAWLAIARAGGGGAPPEGATAPELFAGDWSRFAARVARATADALAHAHAAGVLHRDVKPSNVMVTRDGRALLLDFGLAGTAEVDRITRTGTPVGSLPYMAPEQLAGGTTDGRSDVWSLATTLHELLSFESPFLDVDVARTALRVARGEARPLAARRHAIAWELCVIVAKSLEVDPARRYAGAAALRDDLDRFLARRPIAARAAGPLHRARRFAQRRPALALAVAVAAAAALLLPAGHQWLQRGAREQIDDARADARDSAQLLRELLFSMGPDRSPAEQVPIDELLAATEQRVRDRMAHDPARLGELLATLARVRLRRHEHDQADPPLREAIELLEARGAGVSEASLQLRWLRVAGLTAMGRLEEAAALADASLAPDATAIAPKLRSPLLAVRGTLRVRLGRTREAEADLHEAIAAAEQPPRVAYDAAFASNRLAALLCDTGRAEDALPLLERARDDLAGDQHDSGYLRDVVVAHNLACCRMALGEADAAAPLADGALAAGERRFGSASPALASLLVTRAAVAKQRGRLADAEADVRRAAALTDPADMHGRLDRARACDQLGVVLLAAGRAREACDALREAGVLAEAQPGADPRWLATSLANRADAESQAGDLEIAFDLTERAARQATALDPPASGAAAQAALVAAWVRYRRGDPAGMERELETAAGQLRGARRPDEVLGRIAVLRALACNQRGDGTRAEVEANRALECFRAAGSAESPAFGSALYHRAWARLLRNDVAAAQAGFRESIALLARVVQDGHLFEAYAQNHLGETLVREDAAAAAPHFERALAIRQRCLDPGDEQVAIARHNLGVALARTGDDERALALWEENARVLRAVGTRPDANLAATLDQAARLRLARGEPDVAAELAREGLEHARRLHPAGSVPRALAEALLGAALVEIDEWSEAEELLAAAWRVVEAAPGVAAAQRQAIADARFELARRRDQR